MEIVEELVTPAGKKLQVLKGDLTALPDEHKVDVLVVSAFPNNYAPTENSLIGSLEQAGLSVNQLAQNKAIDLRQQYHCWLSHDVSFHNIRRVLCFEPNNRQNPYSSVAGIFQSIVSFAISHAIQSVAMPLVLTGDQAFSKEEVVKELVRTCLFWLNKPSSLNVVKIVERNEAKLDLLEQTVKQHKKEAQQTGETKSYDFFISYSRKNETLVRSINDCLKDRFRLFFDRKSIDIGANWVNEINEGLEHSERFIVCLSPDYIASKVCQYEYLFCNLKMINQGADCVLPVYLYSASLPFQMQILNYHDAREGAGEQVKAFCEHLLQKYGGIS